MQTIIKILKIFLKLFLILCAKEYYLIRFFLYDRLLFYTKIHLFKKQVEQTKFFMIIASYPQNGQVSENMLKIISILKELDVQVILVSNGALSDSSISDLGEVCNVVIEQSNAGRDFGAFKTGFEYLKQQPLYNTDKIIFMNDSTLILPDNFKLMMKKALSTDWNFLGATENYEKIFHVSSYFFGVSKKIFQSDWFGDFWKSYKRISYRGYTINSGEIKLSKLIIDKGFFPLVLFPSTEVGDKILEEYKKLRTSNNNYHNSSVIMDILNFTLLDSTQNNTYKLNFSEIITLLSTQSNIHRFNLFMILYMDFPFLKRDLVKRGIVQPVTLELLFKKSQLNIDMTHLIEITRTRDTIRWTGGLRGLLIKYGII